MIPHPSRSRRFASCIGLIRPRASFVALALIGTPVFGAGNSPTQPPAAGAPGGPVRRAPTGHLSNYDEAKVGHYALPDPLRLNDGSPVRDARTWFDQRRPEILRAYETQIYGQVPASAPKAHAEIVASGERVEDGAGIAKHVIIHFGPGNDGPKADVVLYVPAHAPAPSPVLLQLVFFRGLKSEAPEPPLPPAFAKAGKGRPAFSETGPVADILARGYAYATFRYTDVQPDNKNTYQGGVEALAYAPGQTKPAPDQWGTITAWAWAASRVLDYLSTNHDVDATRVALIGHSRLGKTVLWASALDPRFAVVFSSCSGEMGAALARRDYGETVDDMAANFPWQFAGNFQKYPGHWSEMPVDSHLLISLSAPRPVFITGGTGDQWADPRGEFLAEVAAGPVYELLGRRGLGTTEFPPVETALTSGDLGWRYHDGPHTITPGDWQAFLTFASRYLHPSAPAADAN
ncbi:MAG TPA: acetylxylan esterase [Opitutaceae bacterium]|nr:acetylxylan esterase [Opitutaceae bacterium]